jgi:hypothetical protein
MGKIQKSLIVKGEIRDQKQLINMASAQAKRMFRVAENVVVLKIFGFEPLIDGYVVVIEFEDVLNHEVVVEKPVSMH